MEEKNLVPQRRFRDFKNKHHWKQSSMKEVVDVYDGTHQTPRYTKNGIMFLSVEDIHSLTSNKYISYEDFEREFKIYPEAGDVLMTRIGDIGTANVIESNEGKAYYVTLALLKKRELDPYFLKENIHSASIKRELWHRTLHIAFPKKINMDEIGKVLINYPCTSEQQKIGEFFKVLDERIANQERKIAKVKALKSAYLTEMFPQEGETVPKRRFKGFEEKWSYYRLSEISSIIGGGTPSTANSDFWNGSIDWYSPIEIGLNVYANGSRRKITELGLQKSSATILPANRTILFTSRAGIGDMAILVKDGATNQGFQSLVLEEEICTYFIYSMGYKIKKYALINASGSTFLEISGKTLEEMKILLPSKQEQQKIGQFFKNLDNQIEMEEKKLDKLQKMKEAYLEEMFV
ncbi:restriction endonuclease subunit S [Halobacillus fulvus]|nr:restriction endonuclease subunit S [Halobacillus fulvus]